MVQEFLSLLTVLVFAVLAALVRIYVPLAIQALNRKAEAVLGTANRDALYAAVKVGLNAASKHGLNGDDLLKKAIAVASMYLNQHRIPVSTALLNEAIQAEQQKRDDRKAEFGTFANPLPTIELTSDGMTESDIREVVIREVEKARLGHRFVPDIAAKVAPLQGDALLPKSTAAAQAEYDRIANEAFASAYEASYQSFRDQLPKIINNNDNDKPR